MSSDGIAIRVQGLEQGLANAGAATYDCILLLHHAIPLCFAVVCWSLNFLAAGYSIVMQILYTPPQKMKTRCQWTISNPKVRADRSFFTTAVAPCADARSRTIGAKTGPGRWGGWTTTR